MSTTNDTRQEMGLETPRNHVLGALQAIANLHGNLSLLPLYEACGANEGASRGIKLATAIEMAREAIPLCEDQAAQLAAERAIKAELVAALEAMDEVGSHIDLSQGLRIGLIFSKQFAGMYAALASVRAKESTQ